MANQKRNKWLYILGGLVVVLVIVGIVGKKQGWFGKEELPEVTVAKAKLASITERVSASGKIKPEVEVKISSDVSGEIIELNVKEGDSVSQGQLLCRIRPDNYKSLVDRAQAAVRTSEANILQSKAALAQAEGRLARIKLEYDRSKKLWEQKVISDADWDVARTNYDVTKQEVESAKASLEAGKFNVESAKASLKDALENLRKTNIYAPVSGTISKLSVEKGERVVGTLQMTGTEIMRLANLHNMEALVDVNENDIVRLTLGDTAEIDVDSYSAQKRKFKGIVTSIANTAKTAISTDVVTEFEVKVRILPESYADLAKKAGNFSPFRPGMTASVEIITERRNNVLTVPLTSVTTRNPSKDADDKKGDKSSDGPKVTDSKEKKPVKDEIKEVVFVYDNGVAKMREVKTSISDFENIQILEGVKEGEEIISGPFLEVSKKLKDGKKVAIKKEGEKRGGFSVKVE